MTEATGKSFMCKSFRSEKLQNKSSPNFSNFRPEFCPGFCSEFSPKFSRIYRASFGGKRRPEKIHQKSPPFFNKKFRGKYEKNIHKIFLESRQSKKVLCAFSVRSFLSLLQRLRAWLFFSDRDRRAFQPSARNLQLRLALNLRQLVSEKPTCPLSLFQGETIYAPPPLFWPKGIFQGRGVGVYILRPHAAGILYPPPFIRPPPLGGCFQGWGGG